MCGFAGVLNSNWSGSCDVLRLCVDAMAATLSHRGPDGGGNWVDPDAGIAFGFRRLAIQDLSAAGDQPITSADGRWIMVMNGEIYNFRTLRTELQAAEVRFRGHSDSEVAVETIARLGLRQALQRFNGMFAMALWDRAERRLHLVRDRLGVKPLYWGRFGTLVVFGVELKALRACSDWPVQIDQTALHAYLRLGYCPAPLSIYQNVFKLAPGTILTIDGRGEQISTYWDMADMAVTSIAARRERAPEALAAELRAILDDAVALRMVADVPVGAFLSGGLDSTTVVALMQRHAGTPIRTFSIGFDAPNYDESPQAKRIADYLATAHTELYLDAREAAAALPHLAECYDEPFADSSQVPTWLLSRLARQSVTVALTGDGGDEFLLGYNRHGTGESLDRWIGGIPPIIRQTLGRVATSVPQHFWRALLCLLPKSMRPGSGGEALAWYARMLARDPVGAWEQLVALWPCNGPTLRSYPSPPRSIDSFTDVFAWLDARVYLPDDILVKVDRASMAAGLEARSPLLDYRLVEWAWSLPISTRRGNGRSKIPLRAILRDLIPETLTEQPKHGFSIPLGPWLRRDWRDWAEALLAPVLTGQDELLAPRLVAAVWKRCLAGDDGVANCVWAILMLQVWRQRWMSGVSLSAQTTRQLESTQP